MARPAARSIQPRGPELGSFPLDHYRECQNEVSSYYKCLEGNKFLAPMCREQAKAYLQCRMDRGLMNKIDVKTFGIPETTFEPILHERQALEQKFLRKAGTSAITPQEYVSIRKESFDIDDGYEVDPKTGKRIVFTSQNK